MKEIEIIRKQLKILASKGYCLDIVNDTICLIDTKIFIKESEFYKNSTNKHQPLKKGGLNGDIMDESKYIICTFH